MSIFSKSKQPRARSDGSGLPAQRRRSATTCSATASKACTGRPSGEHGLKSLPDSTNYAYDSNCNWGVRNDKFWRTVEGGIPNAEELTENWKATARSGRYLTFVFDDSAVKNEVAAVS